MRDRGSAGTRLALAGLGVLTLLAVVALASRGGLGGGGRGAAPSGSVLDYAFSVFLVLYVLTIPVALYVWWLQATEREQPRQRKRGGWLRNGVVFLLFLLVAVAITELRKARGHGIHLGFGNLIPTATAPGHGSTVQTAPTFQWPVVAVAGALLLAAAAVWYARRRQRRRHRQPPGVAAELLLALDDAIDDVRAESDPRRAVIKAYARMEAILAAHGLPRRPPEAPYEYLARTLEELEASGASVGRLTDLYERAKFSLHEIRPDMREDAIGALTAVRDELRAAA